MKKLFAITLLFSNLALAEGYYYPVPPNPPGFVYALPPAYIVPPQQHYYAPPPVYVMPPPAPGITRGVPPTFVPFDTGRVVPRGGFKDQD
jgi:hypothetical protein